MGAVIAGGGALRGLTFELTPRAEAGAVSPTGDDGTAGARRAYSACRSESGVERGVRPRRACVCQCDAFLTPLRKSRSASLCAWASILVGSRELPMQYIIVPAL